MFIKRAVTACLLLGLFEVGPVMGAAIGIDDTLPNGTITITACDFEGGFSVNGNPMGVCNVGAGGSVNVPEPTVTFGGSWISLGQSGSGSRTVYWVEATGSSQVSDILTYSWSTSGSMGTISGSFTSGGNLGTLPGGVALGDVFVDGDSMGFGLAFLGASVYTTAHVPEPLTLGLLGVGLAGLGFSRRKKA